MRYSRLRGLSTQPLFVSRADAKGEVPICFADGRVGRFTPAAVRMLPTTRPSSAQSVE